MTVEQRQPILIDLIALGSFLLLALVFFWKSVLGQGVIGSLDLVVLIYPYKAYIRELISQGELPLWNPLLYLGAPLLANIQAGVLYPPGALFALFSFPAALTWSVLLHVWLALAGMYLFLRHGLGNHRLCRLDRRPLFRPGWVPALARRTYQSTAHGGLAAVALALRKTGEHAAVSNVAAVGRRRYRPLLYRGTYPRILLRDRSGGTFLRVRGALLTERAVVTLVAAGRSRSLPPYRQHFERGPAPANTGGSGLFLPARRPGAGRVGGAGGQLA